MQEPRTICCRYTPSAPCHPDNEWEPVLLTLDRYHHREWKPFTPQTAVEAFLHQRAHGGEILTRDSARRPCAESLLYQVLVHFRTPWGSGELFAERVYEAVRLLLENGARLNHDADTADHAPLVLALEAMDYGGRYTLALLRLLHRFRHVFTDAQLRAVSPNWPRGDALQYLALYASTALSDDDFRDAVGLLLDLGFSPRTRGVYGRADWTAIDACRWLSGRSTPEQDCDSNPFHAALAPRAVYLQTIADREALPERRERAVWVHLALDAFGVPLALQDYVGMWLRHDDGDHASIIISFADAARAIDRVRGRPSAAAAAADDDDDGPSPTLASAARAIARARAPAAADDDAADGVATET
jgi:hypothetical protein